MKKKFNFTSIRLGIGCVLSGVLLLTAIPHRATVSPQPVMVVAPNHFRAVYPRPNLLASVPPQSDKPHTMAASYYSLQGNLKSSITLNNKGLLPLEVTPTLFNLSGERLDVPPVTVDATSFQVFDLAEWAAAGGPTFQQGSLQLFYRGKDLLLGAQVKIIDSSSSLIFDEQMTEPAAMFSSPRLEGLWWLPGNHSQVSIAISNTTDSIQVASLDVEGIAPKQQGSKELILQPHQTLLIDPAQDLSDKPTVLMKAGGISITHSGAPGSLIARAMIENPSTGFSSAVQFTDPRKAKSSSLHGAGLRLGEVAGEEMTPIVVAHNISGGTAVLRGRIPYTKSDGSRGVMPLRELQLRAGEVKAWEIREIKGLQRSEIKSAGLEMDYNTQPGSVIVSALSVSRSGNHVFQVPMLDVAVQKSSTGVYPFYMYGSSSTVAYIKNTTGVEQKYVAHLNYEGGNYVMGVKTIAPGETVTIDIRALRDNQVADEEEQIIPLDVSHGQVRWTIIQSEGTDLLALIGRSEQVDEAKAMSSTYACQNCCGDFAEDVFITPSQVEMQVGQSVLLSAFELRSDCYGFTYPVQQSASWSSNNSSVATVSGGQVTPVAGGETTIKASWNSFSSVATQCSPGSGILGPPDPIGTSCCRSVTNFRSANAQVRVRPRIDGISPARALIGSTIDVTITGAGFGTNPTVQVGGTGITATRRSANATQIVASFAIAANAGTGNHAVTVTTNGQGSNNIDFFVQIPMSFAFLSATTTNLGCSAGVGFGAAIEYQVVDQEGQPIRVSGLTPRELVTVTSDAGNVISRDNQFRAFATPPSSRSNGSFTDTPIGTCFDPPPQGNLCVNVTQLFDILVPVSGGGTVRYDISTITIRRDCVQGIRISVQNESNTETRTLGTVN